MVSFSSEREKFTLIGNLCLLKGIQKYSAVSITEDLTPEERKNLKRLSDQAKVRNENDSSENEKWRVRGNSKNGFFLIKIKLKPKTKAASRKKRTCVRQKPHPNTRNKKTMNQVLKDDLKINGILSFIIAMLIF